MNSDLTKTIVAVLALALSVAPASVAQESVYDSDLFQLGDGQPPPGMPGTGAIVGDGIQAGPDWDMLFNGDGTPRDDYPYDAAAMPMGNGVPDYVELYGGQWAVFTADDISLGSDFEGTALHTDGGVYNATVDPDHDIGNAYIYSKVDSAGNTVLFGAAERLGGGDSFIEFEFNQEHFRLGHGGYGVGAPWEVLGDRQAGDLLVRLDFSGGILGSVTVSSWDGNAWQGLDALPGEGCSLDQSVCAVCNFANIDGGPWQNYDTDGDPEEISVDRFVEFGVNAGFLLGGAPPYDTVRIRTPQDIAFGYLAEGN